MGFSASFRLVVPTTSCVSSQLSVPLNLATAAVRLKTPSFL
jgi:hypothetical protein